MLSGLGISRTLNQLGIKRTFYNWYHAYSSNGIGGLRPKRRTARQWNSIPQEQKNLVIDLALEHPDHSPRMLAAKMTDEQGVFISESSV
ncbi:MAG: helix-turn-helix domain-containing protein [Mangrovibacterium sp.]